MKTSILVISKMIAMMIILFICGAVAGGIAGLQSHPQPPEQAGTAAAALLGVCFLITLVLAHIILRSHWAGSALSHLPASSASLSASVHAGPLSFLR